MTTKLTVALAVDSGFDARLRRRTPTGRWAQPEDLPELAAPGSDFVNSQVISVDGELTAVI
jgi:gluconate 5-dehydrogenase